MGLQFAVGTAGKLRLQQIDFAVHVLAELLIDEPSFSHGKTVQCGLLRKAGPKPMLGFRPDAGKTRGVAHLGNDGS